MVIWDAIVSSLRTYTEEELWEMVRAIPANDTFEWRIGKRWVPWILMRITYLIGLPISNHHCTFTMDGVVCHSTAKPS